MKRFWVVELEKFVALASNEAEFGAILDFAGQRPDSLVKCICLEYLPAQGLGLPNVSLFQEGDFLSKKELDEIDERALFFSRSWYCFGSGFEKAITFNEICLGFVSDFAILNIFKAIFLAAKSAANAVWKEKAAGVLGVKGSFSGECAAMAAKASGAGILELEGVHAMPVNTSLGAAKVLESLGKLSAGIGRECVKGNRNGKLIFVKGDRYLGGLQERLAKEKDFAVCSLDDFVVRLLSNPFNAMAFARVKREKRAFFRNLFAGLFADSSFRERLVFEGMNFAAAFEKRVPRFSERDWPEFVFLIGALRKEFARRRPFALVVWEDWIPFERICVLIAKEFGARSLVVQHGIFKDNTSLPDWIMGFAPVLADRIAVWGPRFKEALVKKRVPPEKISVTGPSRLDSLHNRAYDDAGFRKKLGIREWERLVVLATQPLTRYAIPPLELASATIAAIKRIKNAKLVIKIHPLENKEDYAKIVKSAKGKALLLDKTDLHQLLHCADAVIVHSSTVGFEAMILKKPVIIIIHVKSKKQNCFEGIKGIVIGNKDRLSELLENFLSENYDKKAYEKMTAEFLYDFGFKQDGKATERIVGLLKEWDL